MSRKLLSKAEFKARAASNNGLAFELVVLWPYDAPTRAELTSVFSGVFSGGFSMEADRTKDSAKVRFLAVADSQRLLSCPSLKWTGANGSVAWSDLRQLVD